MFASAPPRRPVRTVDPAALAALAERVRPVAASRTRLLPITGALAGLLPDGGLRRGGTVGVRADASGGAATLAVALASAAVAAGSWVVVVGTSALGALATGPLTHEGARVAFVPHPGGRTVEVVAALIEGVDLVIVRPPSRLGPGTVRPLLARLRDRRAALIVLDDERWPAHCDVELKVTGAQWRDVTADGDCLRQRTATVTALGRGSAVRPQRQRLWLPASDGTVQAA